MLGRQAGRQAHSAICIYDKNNNKNFILKEGRKEGRKEGERESLESGVWSLESGVWSLESGVWSLVSELNLRQLSICH